MSVIIDYFKNMQATKSCIAGEAVFEVGQPDEVMYAVKSGEVEIYFNGALLETAGPGDILGVKSLLDDNPHTTTAIALTDCELVEINEDKFLLLVHETPMFSLHIMRLMAKRTRDMMLAAMQ